MSQNHPTHKELLSHYAAIIGIDWADQKHDVACAAVAEDRATGPIEHSIVNAKPECIHDWLNTLRECFLGADTSKTKIAIAVELSRGPLISLLSAFDWIDIYPIHTVTLRRLREALYPSGAKNDEKDSVLILKILTLFPEHFSVLKPESPTVRELSMVCEDRRKWVDLRTAHMQSLYQACKHFYPIVNEIFTTSCSPVMVCNFLKRWPTHAALRKAKAVTLRRFFHANHVRGDIVEKRVEAILGSVLLTDDSAVVNAMSIRVETLCGQIRPLCAIIDTYDGQIAQLFSQLSTAPLFSGLPGAGAALAPRLAAIFGEDRSKYASAFALQCYTGVGPVTKASGNHREVRWRWAAPKFHRQTMVEWAEQSRRYSPWAKAYYAMCLQRGDSKNCALRKLAYKWLRILYRMWKDHAPYDEAQYIKTLKKRHSPIIGFLTEQQAA